MGFALATACRSLGSQGFCALAIIRGWVLVAFVLVCNGSKTIHSKETLGNFVLEKQMLSGSFGKRFVEALTPLFLQSRDSRCVNLWRCFWKLLHPQYRFHPGSIVGRQWDRCRWSRSGVPTFFGPRAITRAQWAIIFPGISRWSRWARPRLLTHTRRPPEKPFPLDQQLKDAIDTGLIPSLEVGNLIWLWSALIAGCGFTCFTWGLDAFAAWEKLECHIVSLGSAKTLEALADSRGLVPTSTAAVILKWSIVASKRRFSATESQWRTDLSAMPMPRSTLLDGQQFVKKKVSDSCFFWHLLVSNQVQRPDLIVTLWHTR